MQREELDDLVERLRNAHYTNDDDIEESRWLRAYLSRTGFIQLGWAYQGSVFVYEVSTDWYDRYQRLLELAEDFGSIAIDESDQDDER